MTGDLKYTYSLQGANQIITESNLPFTLDLKTSNYDTLYSNDGLRLNFIKNNEEILTLDEFDQLLRKLPSSKTGYGISIAYGKFNDDHKGKEYIIRIFLDKNKRNAHSKGDYYNLCKAIDDRYKK